VEVHRFHLMRKLNVRNVAQLLRRALQLGVLSSSLMRSQAGEPRIGNVKLGVGGSRRLVKRK